MNTNELFDLTESKKAKIHIFTSRRDSSLNRLSARMVYARSAYLESQGHDPTIIKPIARYCGMSVGGVESAIGQLTELGLWNSGPVYNPDFFVPRKGKPGKHWSSALAYWVMYCRAPGSELTTAMAAMYSYLLHCYKSNFARGVNISYLSTILGLSRNTTRDTLATLGQLDLIRYTEKPLKIQVASKFPQELAALFQDNSPTSKKVQSSAVTGFDKQMMGTPEEQLEEARENLIEQLIYLGASPFVAQQCEALSYNGAVAFFKEHLQQESTGHG